MSNYEIEKEVNIPPRQSHLRKYPWHDMEIGDSFEFGKEEYHRVTRSSDKHAERYDKKFTIRTISETRCRVWRTK